MNRWCPVRGPGQITRKNRPREAQLESESVTAEPGDFPQECSHPTETPADMPAPTDRFPEAVYGRIPSAFNLIR